MKNTTALTLILVSIGLFYTFVDPQLEKVKVLRAEASQYEGVLKNAAELAKKRDELMVKYRAIPEEEVQNLKKILPDNLNTVRLAIDLDSIAARYGIAIKSVGINTKQDQTAAAIAQSESGDVYERVTVSFSFVSDYANFRQFMSDMEKSLRLTDVRAITFQSAESGLYEYKVDIETYWLK